MIGLSTYAYFWRMSATNPNAMTLDDAIRDTAALGIRLFQICDHAPLAHLSDGELADVRSLADDLGVTLEVGTRGTDPEALQCYLHIAGILGATLVRTMWTAGDDRPDAVEVERRLREVLPQFEAAGVTLALETYEQVTSSDLVALVEAIASPRLKIVLDPANTVANLEHPADVTARCLPHVANWHVKDFAFSRKDGWVGFALTSTPLGQGRLDYDGIRAALDARDGGTTSVNQIVEHWLPWQGDPETTSRLEAEWTTKTIEHLRRKNND
ncbi:sugar phosphate isomerase/epimerase family protein [Marisediminicola sp. LYQ134]|uniref:sugar phosphate isomerase/epimerase family protein n=1 Tax=Marisediminicola sp. LYQ134 TaxID=3391061 RepID=UPI003983D280